jgi:hypothetical protein
MRYFLLAEIQWKKIKVQRNGPSGRIVALGVKTAGA